MSEIPVKISNILNGLKEGLLKSQETIRIIDDFFLEDLQEYVLLLYELDQLILKKRFKEDEVFQKLNKASNEIVEKGSRVEREIESKALTKKIKVGFREIVGKFVYQSLLMERAYKKPRGYPGDYLTLEYIYNNQPLSKGIGFFFDKYFLSNKLAIAVRNRKDLMASILNRFISETELQKMDILNIASGSCRDIKEFLNVYRAGKILKFNCLDYDEDALEFSKKAIKEDKEIKLNFINDDAIKFAKNILSRSFEKQDIIYSIGLADYMPDRILQKMICSFFGLLKDNGRLILAHKDKHRFSPLPPDWFCDWKFIPRDEPKLISLVNESGARSYSLKTEREKSGVIFFTILEKHG